MHLHSRGSAAAAAVLAVSATLAAAVPASAAPTPAPTSTGSATTTTTGTGTGTGTGTAASTSTPAPTVTPSPTPRTPLPVITVPVPSPTRSVAVPVPSPTRSVAVPVPLPTVSVPAVPLPTPTLPAPVPVPTPTPTRIPVPVVPAPVGTHLSLTSGRTSLARTVTMTGSHLGNLANVYVGAVAVTALAVLDDSHARFVIPSAVDWQAGARKVTLRSGSDWTVRATRLTFTYLVKTRVERQMAYAFQNWNRTSSARFGYLSDNDCANFTSQTLLARGWKPSSQWFDAGQGDWSATWVSSTAMSDWLKHRPDLATHLLYRQRDQVVVGDIVQFHWGWSTKKYSGWDHTAVVSKVVVLPNGRHDIYYVAHTNNSQYGGSTQYFAQHFTKRLRIQFFHILH